MPSAGTVVFRWYEVEVADENGVLHKTEAMVPTRRYRKIARAQFQLGEDYALEPVTQRSMASHNAFFAEVKKVWDNIRETGNRVFETPDHLRKWALIETGWFREKEFIMDTKKDAYRLGTFIQTEDEFAQIHIEGNRVIVRKAKSQRMYGHDRMNAKDFQASKKDVLDCISALIGVPPSQVKKEARIG